MVCTVEQIHKGDIGTVFEATIRDGCDIQPVDGATTLQIKFRKPDNETVLPKTAIFKTDGTDGIIQYVSEAGDLDEVGDWKIQGFVVLPAGSFNSNIEDFEVFDNL